MVFTVIRFGVWNSNNRLYLRESIKIPSSGPVYPEIDPEAPIGEFYDTTLLDDQVVCHVRINDCLHKMMLAKGFAMYPVGAGMGNVSGNGVVRNFCLTHLLLTPKPAIWIDGGK